MSILIHQISLLLFVVFIANQLYSSLGKSLCISGSNNYQELVVDCEDTDKSYTGVWYCSTVEICESHINADHTCAYTHGCAKEEECYEQVPVSVPTAAPTYSLTPTALPSGFVSNAPTFAPSLPTLSPSQAPTYDLQEFDGQMLLLNNEKPGGMAIRPTCCKAKVASDDDAVVTPIKDICNSNAASFVSAHTMTTLVLTSVIALIICI